MPVRIVGLVVVVPTLNLSILKKNIIITTTTTTSTTNLFLISFYIYYL